MAKVTLIWVSKPDKPFRIISIPKHLMFIALGGCTLIFLSSLVLFFAARSYSDQHFSDQQENLKLQQSLSQRKELIQQQMETLSEKSESVKALQDQLAAVTQQLHQIQASESKIRHFLGLEDKAGEVKHPNQGGIGMLQLPSYPSGEVSSLPETKAIFPSSASELPQTLQNSMQELLGYLEKKQEETSRLPTILPVAANDLWLSCGFGWRSNPFSGKGKEFHFGLDIAGPSKSRITAPANGEVIEAGEDRLLGNYVKIRHSKRLITVYGHMESLAVAEGDAVKREDLIGYMGNTGRSTGVHLHYSVIKDGKYVDPVPYIWDRTLSTLAQGSKNDEPL